MKIMNLKIKILIGVLVVGILLIGGWWVLTNQQTSISKISCENIIVPKIIDRNNSRITVEQIYDGGAPRFFTKQPFDEKENKIEMRLGDTITYYHGEEWITYYRLKEITKNYIMFEYEDVCVPPACDFEGTTCNLRIYTDNTCEMYHCFDSSDKLKSQY
ncbi:MAG: hypothetical protein DRO76_02925 [Candidatus Altiarchaeales archaeon]|nr:MAG: hypothetical protein DRO76_02925 [Candidatus Altiarchaeales archaeon]